MTNINIPVKNTHFVTIISPVSTAEPVSVSIDLTKEEYELINRISVLFDATADMTQPILAISRAVIDNDAEDVSSLDVNPQSEE